MSFAGGSIAARNQTHATVFGHSFRPADPPALGKVCLAMAPVGNFAERLGSIRAGLAATDPIWSGIVTAG